MFNTEEEAYAAFGVEMPEEPEPGTEVTEEGTEETPTGELVEQPTEEQPTEEQPEGQVEDPEGGDGGGEDPLEKLRRELNEQHRQELENTRAEAARQLDERIAGMGLKNPYDSNKPITTWAEYEAYLNQNQDAQWNRLAKQTGMSREQLDNLIAKHPDVVKGLQAQAQAQEAQKQAEQQKLRAKLDADIRTIAAECPEVKDIDSLVSHPSYAKVAAKMKAIPGLSVADAFFLVNRTDLAAGSTKKTAQRVRNNLAGKGHMKSTGSRGDGAHTITREQEAVYRKLMPNATRAEILKYFQEDMKGE